MSGAHLGLDSGYGGPAPGTSPITIQQKIVYTAFPDSGRRRPDSGTYYGGTLDSDHMRILRGEPCVMESRVEIITIGSMTRESQLFVFSCLNHWGDKKLSKAELVRSLTWGGFAGNDSDEDHKEGKKDRRAFPVFFGGSFTIANNGPDTWFTGDLIYWDLPNDDAEAVMIAKRVGRLKSRPIMSTRRTVILRKYSPDKQGMTKKAIRATNDTSNLDTFNNHAAGNSDHHNKAHVDLFDALKKIFMMGMVAASPINTAGTKKEILEGVKKLAATPVPGYSFDEAARKVGLQSFGGVTPKNKHVHEAILAMLMPANGDDRLYDTRKSKAVPTSANRFTAEEKVLKQIQGGGQVGKFTEANVVEQLLATFAQGQHEISKRIVGKCISSSKSGGDTDIVSFSL